MDTTTDNKPVDHLADCALSLYRIAEALEEISSILESCQSGQLDSGRHAILTIPLTE